MSGTNKNIRDFFKPFSQPSSLNATANSTNSKADMPHGLSNTTTIEPPSLIASKPGVENIPPISSRASDHREYTSSLSPPPNNLSSSSPHNTPKAATVQPAFVPRSPDRVIAGSDDDDSDSDSSLEDLSTLLQSKSSEHRPKPTTNGYTTLTPVASKAKRKTFDFHSSPLTVQPKYKFDLKSLISHAEKDEATEASSKRVKAMMEPKDGIEQSNMMPRDDGVGGAKFVHGDLLESVVTDKEDGGMQMVTRALMRTEATLAEKRWYFFDTRSKPTNPKRQAFPKASIPDNWKKDLVDPQLRYHTFVSGFAENMVAYGRVLPDELFLWMLDEICFESQDVLRTSYCNVLKESSEQVCRLIVPDLISRKLQGLGGSSVAVDITQKIVPISALIDPYAKRDWTKLQSTVKLFGQFAKSLQQKSRTHIICMLLRMSVDQVVLENIDLLDLVQETIYRLCRSTSGDSWESSVRFQP